MKGKGRARVESHGSGDNGERFNSEQLEAAPVLGDVMWVKREEDGLWWPAVVVDGKSISASSKPRNKSKGAVLVRLYGSYQLLYVDPVKCHSEFESTLEEKGGCYYEMFMEALEQDLPQPQCGRSKGKGSDSKGASNGRSSASKEKKSNGTNCERESSDLARVSLRKQINTNTPQRKTKDDNLLSKIVEQAIIKASKEDGFEKELILDTPNTESNSKGKTPKQDGVQNKLKRNCNSTVNGRAKNKSHDQGEKKRLKQTRQSAATDISCQTPKQDKVQEENELSPSSAGGTFFGRLQELRRTKVMQTLGLAAPSGSPFN